MHVLIKRLVRAIYVICLMLACTSYEGAHSQTQITKITTSEGVLSIRPGKGTDCYACQGLYLNGRQILHEQYVFLTAAYPTFQNPQLVSVSTSTGGNCCLPIPDLLDFSVKPHLTVSEIGFDKDIARSQNGVVFTQYTGSDGLGDRLLGLYEYVLGSGKAILKKKIPEYSTGPLNQKQYPDDVLSDPVMREPLLQLLGKKYFPTFRMHTEVAGKVKIIDDRVIIGAGCQPHDCNDAFAIFIIDTKKNLAWAAEGESASDGKRSARIWGVLGKNDQKIVSEISEWMASQEIPSDAISRVPLPNSVAMLYEARTDADANGPLNSANLGKIGLSTGESPVRATVLAPVELFKLLAPSIYVVHARRSNGDEFQGSAVAVSSTILLTNCHVVAGADSIKMTQGDSRVAVSLVSADIDADRCVLKSETPLGQYVPTRKFGDLKIGERVYSIGAPAGLELTMTDGLLSGKRPTSGQRLIQTSAPISPGSSGGGLFDEAGNLIGITTFRLKDAENLNFAISAEDYLELR